MTNAGMTEARYAAKNSTRWHTVRCTGLIKAYGPRKGKQVEVFPVTDEEIERRHLLGCQWCVKEKHFQQPIEV